ncbi:unnamed protein product [Polarella glacialis]|uniref:Uncharacterized protein n=1 Tax=Polarella glacialis TaxID=89957 RepID=A0A813D149_POLGL|nr:unnamed protein product [Polarella glacialis]
MPMLRADGRRSCSIRCFICAAGAVALSVWQVQVSSNALPKLLVATASGVTASQKAVVLLAGVGTSGTSTPGGQRNVGRLFAEQLLSMGADVSCIARTAEAAEELKAMIGLWLVATFAHLCLTPSDLHFNCVRINAGFSAESQHVQMV